MPEIIQANDGSFEIRDLEVFRAGDYGAKGSYTDADLALIARSYSSQTHEAPVTIDHKQEGPALGWVAAVKARGHRLFADLRKVPAEFAQAIKEGAYRKRSVEIYRQLTGSAGPYLKAVSFLGAAAPHVKGMEDIAFAAGEAVSIDSALPSFEAFAMPAEIFPRPDGNAAGVLKKSYRAGEFLGHWHEVVLDELGNGFTSAPKCWEEDYGHQFIKPGEPGFHQHDIIVGVMQPADDGNGNLHVHPSPESGALYQEGSSMSDTAKTTEKEPTPVSKFTEEQFNALVAENKRLADALESQGKLISSMQADRAAERTKADFEEGFNKALADGRVTPAEKDGLFAVYSSLPESTEQSVAFGEKKLTPRQAFVASLSERPVVVQMGATVKTRPASASSSMPDPQEDPQAFTESKHARIEKYRADCAKSGKKPSYSEALLAVEKEMQRED
jgi:hypothetical protein